jgi:uroporphyrinogen-III synthase
LEALAAKGGICRRVEAYRNVPVGGAGEAYRALLASGPIDAVVFLSGSAVKAFRHALGDDFAPLCTPGGHGPAKAVLGKTAADALREFGAAADIVPEKPSLASLGGAIARFFN